MSRRALVVTLDACGVGALPDAADYGDEGANTLGHLAAAVGGLDLPALATLGLGAILPLDGLPGSEAHSPVAVHGRLAPTGPGKDSVVGHWELMGLAVPAPLPTYPEGLGDALIGRLEQASGRRFCDLGPSNGLAAISEHGARHLETGELILYTSQDSVVQVAAHRDRVSEDELVGVCAAIREELTGPDAVGRVIARPFAGEPGAFRRTAGRRDLSIDPPGRTTLDALADAGVAVHAVGKVRDLFAGRGVAVHHPAAGNREALAVTTGLLEELDAGMVFTNLVDTDQLYGHRKDVAGFHAALRDIDAAVAGWLQALRDGDLLVLTADHGCDPASAHTDHTREFVPLLAVAPGLAPSRHDGAMADVGASVHVWLTGRRADGVPGESFLQAR